MNAKAGAIAKISNDSASDQGAFKIALLSSFTFSGMGKALKEACGQINVGAQIYIAGYNQYVQEILDKKSGLYSFNPDLVVLFIDAKTLLGDLNFLPYRLSDEERKSWVVSQVDQMSRLVTSLSEKTAANIIFHNFEVPIYSPLGILENKQEFGIIESIGELNRCLRANYKKSNRVFLFDYDAFCARVGKENIFDPKMYYLGDIKLAVKHLPALAREYLSYIKPMLSKSKKCIVLDLDNTLWGGVVGEEGIEGIKLGPTPEGRPFWEFQKHLLALRERGILLAINSKNNSEDALKAIREHPYMVLKEEYFSAARINWTDKATNMKEIAKDLNIGMDSFVFIDDDKLNREMIKELLPEVQVVDLPDDSALYSWELSNINDFNLIQLTEEDKKRGEMYALEKKRDQLRSSVGDFDEFIRSLDLRISVLDANKFTIPRISQLTKKTNQFNLTTTRYEEKQIEEFAVSKNHIVKCYQVADKFGDYGITGVAIIKKKEKNWHVGTFLLSCRVLGKRVEFAVMSNLIETAKKNNIEMIFAEFIPTGKNKPAKNFYDDCGFTILDKKEEAIRYKFNVSDDIVFSPDYIKINPK